jgi:uncharacterized protein (DUF1330 family)/ribosomal protein L37E
MVKKYDRRAAYAANKEHINRLRRKRYEAGREERIRKHSQVPEKKIGDFIFVYRPGHPGAMCPGYLKKCRVVVEDHLGRLLRKEEKVTHINGIKTDDRLENLLLFPNTKELVKWQFSVGPYKSENKPEVKIKGFVYVRKPGHPSGGISGYVQRARLVMEDHLGRRLTKKERVLHINGIRDDDRLENLLLFPNMREYNRYYRDNEPEGPHKRRLERDRKRNRTGIHVGSKRIRLAWHVRKGICSLCGITEKTKTYHALGDFPIFSWFGLEELCLSCLSSTVLQKSKRELYIERVGIGPNSKRVCSSCGSQYPKYYRIRDSYNITPHWYSDGKGGWLCGGFGTCNGRRRPLEEEDKNWHIGELLSVIKSKELEIYNEYSDDTTSAAG